MAWSLELATIDLGDERLKRRAVTLLEALEQNPSASIPGACQSWGETQAAYRFLSNDKVNWEAILSPHLDSVLERMRGHPVVLTIQDTTQLNYHGQEIEGLGPLSYEAQRGLYLHPTYAVTPDREPLGVVDAWMWAREFKDKEGQRGGVSESQRWLEGYERVAEHAPLLPQTRQVYVADREADIVALLRRAKELDHPADYLIRCQHNRSLAGGKQLWHEVAGAEMMGKISFELPRGRNRKARKVEQELRVARVTIPDGKKGKVEVTCLLAQEINPPPGCQAVVWRLLTNRLAQTREAVLEVMNWYLARWEIELFFLILKQGCKVEGLQLSTKERLESALMLYLLVAWKINRLMRLGRSLPELKADVVFDEDEWRAAFILNKMPPPIAVPLLNEVVRLVAKLGGFLGRKRDGEPGVKTIWLGMQQVATFVDGLRYVKALQASGICV